jgi:hypothetical protein
MALSIGKKGGCEEFRAVLPSQCARSPVTPNLTQAQISQNQSTLHEVSALQIATVYVPYNTPPSAVYDKNDAKRRLLGETKPQNECCVASRNGKEVHLPESFIWRT